MVFGVVDREEGGHDGDVRGEAGVMSGPEQLRMFLTTSGRKAGILIDRNIHPSAGRGSICLYVES